MEVYIVMKSDALTGFLVEVDSVFDNEAAARFQQKELQDNNMEGKVWIEEHEVGE